MFDGLKRYIAHTGSNLIGFSEAMVQSASSLVPDRAATIATSLFHISMTDFLPASMAFSVNGYLQDSFTQYTEQLDEASVYRNGVILFATSMNLLFYSFIISHTLRGSARTLALTATIPHLLQEESTDVVPHAKLYDAKAIRVNLLEFMGGYVIDTGVEFMLPEHYIIKFFLKLLVGYEIVNSAVSRNDLMRLSHLQIKSLPLLVGSLYLLGSYIKDFVLLGSLNPYLNFLIDKCLLISLFAVTANLKLRNVNLQSESHSLDAVQDFASSLSKAFVEILLYSFSEKIRNFTPPDLKTILRAMGVYTKTSLTIAKITVLPTMLHSPKEFFDDEVISKLLESLPQEVKVYLHKKYSQKQIETFLGYLEIAITKRNTPRYAEAFCGFFTTKKWTGEFQSKLRLLADRRIPISLETENITSQLHPYLQR